MLVAQELDKRKNDGSQPFGGTVVLQHNAVVGALETFREKGSHDELHESSVGFSFLWDDIPHHAHTFYPVSDHRIFISAKDTEDPNPFDIMFFVTLIDGVWTPSEQFFACYADEPACITPEMVPALIEELERS